MSVSFNLQDAKAAIRSMLPAGSIFVYGTNPNVLMMVPDATMTKFNIDSSKTDVIIGGPHSGTFKDARPNSCVISVDLSVTRSAQQLVRL